MDFNSGDNWSLFSAMFLMDDGLNNGTLPGQEVPIEGQATSEPTQTPTATHTPTPSPTPTPTNTPLQLPTKKPPDPPAPIATRVVSPTPIK